MRNKFLNTGQAGFRPLRKLKICMSGLRYAVLADFSVAYKILLSCILLAFCLALHKWFDLLLLIVATGVMVISEIFNTTIEAICDMIQPDEDPRIGIIKDIAAAAAGVSILIWVIVFVFEVASLL
ncbi:diacylglycerol kinase [Desulfobacter sp.]